MNKRGEITIYEIFVFIILAMMAFMIMASSGGNQDSSKGGDYGRRVDIFLHSTIPKVQTQSGVLENLTVADYIQLWAHGKVKGTVYDVKYMANHIFGSHTIYVSCCGEKRVLSTSGKGNGRVVVERHLSDVTVEFYLS